MGGRGGSRERCRRTRREEDELERPEGFETDRTLRGPKVRTLPPLEVPVHPRPCHSQGAGAGGVPARSVPKGKELSDVTSSIEEAARGTAAAAGRRGEGRREMA